jgi:hypothetical protein
MGVWSWARRVVADRGEEHPVPITLERTPDGGYAFCLGLRAGFGGGDAARIPVSVAPNPHRHPILKEIHACEVAGTLLQAANMQALRAKVAQLLDQLAPGRTLPLCWLRAPVADEHVTIYEERGALVCPRLGGRALRARDLATMRRHVARRLISAGYVEDADDLEVTVLQPRDLRRVAPAAVLRSLADDQVWAPCVAGIGVDGPVVGLLESAVVIGAGGPARPARRAETPAAPDVVGLLRFLRAELAREGRAEPADALYAADVQPDAWAVAEARTTDAGMRLTAFLIDDDGARLELPVRRTAAGDLVTALQDGGIVVLLAEDETRLADCVGRHVVRAGFLPHSRDVAVESVLPPRPERLDAEAITTREPHIEEEARV